MQELLTAVRQGLAAAGDPERAAGQQRYMKSVMPFRGVRLPQIRALCRTIYDEHGLPNRESWETTVRLLWDDAEFREERYAAIELSGHRTYVAYHDSGALPLYEYFIVSGAWWDYVDSVAIHRIGPIARSEPQVVAPILRSWASGMNLWRRRTSIIAQIGASTDTDLDQLTFCLAANLDHRDFFVRKAIGWALRDYARTDPDWVRRYLAEYGDRMSGLSKREAAKHL